MNNNGSRGRGLPRRSDNATGTGVGRGSWRRRPGTSAGFGNRQQSNNDAVHFSTNRNVNPERQENPQNRQRTKRSHQNGSPGEFHQKRRRILGFKLLETFLDKDLEELTLELLNNRFNKYTESNLTPDAIILVVKILSRVCDSNFDETKLKILHTSLNATFLDMLTKFIACIPVQTANDRFKNKYFWRNTDEFWNNVIRICKEVLNTIPTFACEALPKLVNALVVYIQIFENVHKQHVSDEIMQNINQIDKVLKEKLQEYEEQKLQDKAANSNSKNCEEEPPDNFRDISVYPSTHELLGKRGFIRQNVIHGKYKDVNHYLDVQFRLLREDFVSPLRDGIATYFENQNSPKKRTKIENVRIHKKVVFLNAETMNEYYCLRLRFDSIKRKKNFKYENSKRFMFGSLLCFTSDNFRSLIFGRVSDRKLEDLENGELIAAFDENVIVDFKAEYIMVECSVYFEPYYHVLNVLKNMTTDNFPMERYLIQVAVNVLPPNYLENPDIKYVIEGYEFHPLYEWPAKRFYNLNQAQVDAFKAAIAQEFCVIQGPPGTGKTFLGLRIAHTLLKNKTVWYNRTPMLVICYTNHALDQFLEGLLPCTTRIMRIGGQSKNEKLQGFNLRNKKRFRMNEAIYQQRYELRSILSQIKNVTENLKCINSYDSIRDFSVFKDVIPHHFENTWFSTAKIKDFLNWLLEGGERNFPMQNNSGLLQVEKQLNQIVITDDPNMSDSDDDNDEINVNEQQLDDDDIFNEVFDAMNVQCGKPLVTLKNVRDQITSLASALTESKSIQEPTLEDLANEETMEFELHKLQSDYQYLQVKLNEGKYNHNQPRILSENLNLRNPFRMSPDERWNLYFYWLNLYREKLKEKLELFTVEFRKAFKIYEQARNIEDTNAMKEVLVVGMTTTSAARLRSTLQTLKSPIVIVEEAAEVLEAHIITSLTNHCKHLILIGDHQQLKPSASDFTIERHYNLGISLFERMIINKIQCYTLNVQHRMKPDISSLITPTIYPRLEDHPSTLDRKPITGIDKCLYFIDHTHKEAECEGTSKKNYHEVSFLILLARHLILNGYKAENITILAAYLGQMFEMHKERKQYKNILENVRISVLDNYQGEECDIILLSLVRNNDENKIGFLSIENRVCVALSRARDGLYIMGNMTQLCHKSGLWQKIRATLVEKDCLGPELSLRCQVHLDTVTSVKLAEDFYTISEGGCSQKCGADLSCGHICTLLCHVLNRDHQSYKCREECRKPLCDKNDVHLCKKMCYEDCGPCNYLVIRELTCGHQADLECHMDPDKYKCMKLIPVKLPCDHDVDMPCHCNPETFRCPHPCDSKVEPCGHSCEMKCHIRSDPDHLEYKCKKKCARYRANCTVKNEEHLCRKLCYEECDDCTIRVQKFRSVCPHVYTVPCCDDVDALTCTKPCKKILTCGHKCKSKCFQTCGPCEEKVNKTAPLCGHKIVTKCSEEPKRENCKQKCPLMLPCGHKCTSTCNKPCTMNCQQLVDCKIESPCGHTITKLKCSLIRSGDQLRNEKILLESCHEPCKGKLLCGHVCSGTCSECFQGRIHKRCAEKCSNILVCNHECSLPCREACRPCKLPCSYNCEHSKCRKRCGDVCTPCKEPCPRRCEHQKCSKMCGEKCNVQPCDQPCPKLLKCGHFCIGFCGDPCPPKCLICDKEELLQPFLGFEDESSRYVYLQDCQHVIESEGMEYWLQNSESNVSFKVCPQCKAPIKTTRRYNNYIKTALEDVAEVKSRSNGNAQENGNKRKELEMQLRMLEDECPRLIIFCPSFKSFLKNLRTRLQESYKYKRQFINKFELNAITSKVQIAEHLIKLCCNPKMSIEDSNELFFPQLNFILSILMRENDFISNQEINDIKLEMDRFSRMLEFHLIKKTVQFKSMRTTNRLVIFWDEKIQRALFSFKIFTNECSESVKQQLKVLNELTESGIGISDTEKREILQAMGLQKGHWFKCPNGHIYAIGDCGGAMQEAKCNECGAIIGGGHHLLRRDNALATEMDGARHAAWSEAANMANFDLRN